MRGHGGAYVAKGTYGCVFDPPFPCTATERRADVVGKVMMQNTEAIKEMRLAERMQALDPHQAYFLYPLGSCKIMGKALMADPEFGNCGKVSGRAKRIQLIMPNGGQTLYEFVEGAAANSFSRADLLRMVYPILKGVQILVHNGLIHQDIKPMNIMVKPDGQVRLIDFGLLTPVKKVYGPANEGVWDAAGFAVSPPEYRLIYPRYAPSPRETYAHETVLVRNYTRQLYPMSYNQVRDRLHQLYRELMQSPSQGSRTKFFARFAAKSDVYSTGLVLLFMTRLLAPGQSDPHAADYQRLLHGMLDMSCITRLTIDDALAIVDAILGQRANTPPPIDLSRMTVAELRRLPTYLELGPQHRKSMMKKTELVSLMSLMSLMSRDA